MPVHEGMQTAQSRHFFRTRAEHQVVGISQNNGGACRGDLFRLHRLDRACGADRHEGRGRNRPMRGGQLPDPRRAVPAGDRKSQSRCHGAISAPDPPRVSRQASP